MRLQVNVWLSVKECAKKLSVSDDTIYRRAVPYQAAPVPNRIRYKILKLDDGTEEGRRFLDEDAERLLHTPQPLERPGRRTLFGRAV
jgi:predicted DNA-binding transcriptional regulator YafY